MSYAQYLKDLLAPLRVYDLDAPFNGGELYAQGAALDKAETSLDETQREAIPLTAQTWGLETLCGLVPHRPAANDAQTMGQALAALLRIGGDSFTLSAIRDTLTGCGAVCQVEEGETAGIVTISFPNIPGVPEEFSSMKETIEEILPAHLQAQYVFWYITWLQLEEKLPSWQAIETLGLTWKQLETYV